MEAITFRQPLREQEAKQKRNQALCEFRAGPWLRRAVTHARHPAARTATALTGSHRSCCGHRAHGRGRDLSVLVLEDSVLSCVFWCGDGTYACEGAWWVKHGNCLVSGRGCPGQTH